MNKSNTSYIICHFNYPTGLGGNNLAPISRGRII